eukprot:COSAG02_NODE_18058_length_963_cov_2192.956019_1_plen_47_part_10
MRRGREEHEAEEEEEAKGEGEEREEGGGWAPHQWPPRWLLLLNRSAP